MSKHKRRQRPKKCADRVIPTVFLAVLGNSLIFGVSLGTPSPSSPGGTPFTVLEEKSSDDSRSSAR